MGDSAGGNLSIATVLWIRENGARFNIPMPAGFAGLSPWLDLTHSQPSYILNGDYDYLPYQSKDPKYINENRNHYYTSDNSFLTNPLVSPLYADIKDSSIELPRSVYNVALRINHLKNESPQMKSEVTDSSFAQVHSQKKTSNIIPLPPILCQVGSAE
ncbi:hypothetical protein HK096_005556, partial [Nowakowskiella sp. JEL0078]